MCERCASRTERKSQRVAIEIGTSNTQNPKIISRLTVCSLKAKISADSAPRPNNCKRTVRAMTARSEEHTSELQSLAYLVCRLLLEKKKKKRLHTKLRQRTTDSACD